MRVLNEAECYARCYGDHEDAVQVIRFERSRPSFVLTGEDIRRLFELRLDARDPELAAEAA